MKKNYLLISLLGALVITGCKGNNDSSKNSVSSTNTSETSSSSTVEHIPTVEEGVSTVKNSYTVSYTVGNTTTEYSNKLEELSEGKLVYFSEYLNGGYYIENEKAYIMYLNGYNQAIYTTNGDLGADGYDELTSMLDLKTSFSGADWTLVGSEGGDTTYYTEDEEAILTAGFLTDVDDVANIGSLEVTINVKKNATVGKISGFTTYDLDGEILAEAEVKRIGNTYAIAEAPVLNDDLDLSLVNKWLVVNEDAAGLASYMDSFAVDSEGNLTVEVMNDNGLYSPTTTTYRFIAPAGDGSYLFVSNQSTSDFLLLQNFSGALNFVSFTVTGAEEMVTTGYGVALEYYSTYLMLAAYTLGYGFEEMPTDDPYYSQFITAYGAVKGYYIYSYALDENNEPTEEADELAIIAQYASEEAMIEYLLGGDVATFNGNVYAGGIYGTMIAIAGSSNSATQLFNDCTAILAPSAPYVDLTLYTPATEGQTAIDYVINHMTAKGYSYVTKADFENATAKVDSETGEPVVDEYGDTVYENLPTLEGISEETTNSFCNLINIVTSLNISGDEENPLCASDYYVFYKVEELEGQEYEVYSGIAVFDVDMSGYFGGYGNTYLFGVGYYMAIGEIYGALHAWSLTLPAVEA